MRFKVPNIENIQGQYDSLCSWIDTHHSEPFHKTSLMEHKRKYLGHYVTLDNECESELSVNKNFIVYDLYVYEGSKFTGRTFIAVFGDNQLDYICSKEAELLPKSNKELSNIPTGEAYRRYRKRKIIKGNLTKLR